MDNILKAYEDIAFLNRPELRPVRLQLELLKPELKMEDMNIRSTVVMFGSARTLPPDVAQERLERAETDIKKNPDSEALKKVLKRAHMDVRHSQYYQIAREFAAAISQLGQEDGQLDYVVTTGGGPGIMEAANRGAHDVGAYSIGLNITLPHEQNPNQYISPELNFLFHYFSVRKMHFLLRAKALLAFPGGFGTMDELFETLTLIQTHKAPRIPIIIYGREYYDALINWQTFVDWGTISPEDLDLIHYADTVQEGIDYIINFWEKQGTSWLASSDEIPEP